MYRRMAAVCLVLLLLWGCAAPGQKKQVYEITWLDAFDTVTTLRGYETDQQTFQKNAAAVHEMLLYYHHAFDIYNPTPEQNTLYTVNENAGIAPVTVDGQILDFLEQCREDYRQTNGRVNAAMGSVLRLWHEAREAGIENPETAALPDRTALEEAAKHCSFDTVRIDRENGTVFLEDPLQSLDVGAIAKGWAGQRVLEQLPEGYLLNLGGNVCAKGTKPDGSQWKIGVQDPTEPTEYLCLVKVTNQCAVTSGDYQRCYTVDGVSYHHIIDPDTLMPAQRYHSVTILCPDSGAADCLSTALFLLPMEEGRALARQYSAEAMWVAMDGTITQTDGFRAAVS